MSKYFRPWNIDQTLLLPPSVQDFVPKGHVSRFIVELVRESLDLKEITGSYVSGLGQPPFDPRMMVALLLHGYASGLYSSRRIARACRERNDFVMIVALDPPDFRTINDFRKRHLKALGALFRTMSKYFRPWNIDQTLLLPPSVQDFVPAGHVSRFIVELVRESLDLKEITGSYVSGLGQPPFDPRMMVALLLHGYASGLYSSRRIARACRERNDFVMIVALDPPDFRTINDFRKRHLKALGALFRTMSKYFRPWNIDQTLLLPPNVQDFVPKGHVSRFIVELVRESLDLKEITGSYVSGLGQPPFDPGMMVALLLHSYVSGLYSSRRIASACRERNDFVMIVALDPPDFRTINDFRKRHLKALGALFRTMSKYFRPWNIDQTLLLPPNVQDFVPKGHVSRFIVE